MNAAPQKNALAVPSLWHRFMSVQLGTLLKWTLALVVSVALLAMGAFALYVVPPAQSVPDYEFVDQYVYLNQGWGDRVQSDLRQTYYYTGQGTSLPQGSSESAVRYDWFVNLELPFSRKRFADPEHMRAYRFIVDAGPTERNPDQLPLGFTKHFDANAGEYLLDITCAACHSGQLEYTRGDTRYAVRIDGGQAMHAFTATGRGSFAPMLVASLLATVVSPPKFNRFARAVLGDRYPTGKGKLRQQMRSTIAGFVSSGQNNPFKHLYPVTEGFGRTDALGRIANTVFGDHLIPGNYRVADAPVSYPYLWNIWKFDWVQYNGSVTQPLARNVGEAMGVGAVINLRSPTGEAIPANQRYESSIDVRNLMTIEHTLQQLKPPRWPEEVFGPIDQSRADAGKLLFESHCQSCHGPHVASAARQRARAPGKSRPADEWRIEVIPVEHIGTDPNAAVGFVERKYDLSPAGITNQEVAGLLKPLMLRHLARDVRYRLEALIDARQAVGLPIGRLDAILEDYPDVNTAREVSLPRDTFAAIVAEMGALNEPPLPVAAETPPADLLNCDELCQRNWLVWNVQRGERHIDQQLEGFDIREVSEGEGLNILGLMVKKKYFADRGISYQDQQCIEGFGTLDLPQQVAGYKPRPLEGVWATPPFLHNGSVPNLYQMLLPPEERDVRFFVGRREFDPRHVGYVSEPLDEDEDNGFWLDTRAAGNHNTGHGFAASAEQWAQRKEIPLPPGIIGPELTDADRWSLVEYLKVHRDDAPATSDDYRPPQCGPWASDA